MRQPSIERQRLPPISRKSEGHDLLQRVELMSSDFQPTTAANGPSLMNKLSSNDLTNHLRTSSSNLHEKLRIQ